MAESKVQLQMLNSDPDCQQLVLDAVKILNETWEKDIFGLIPAKERDKPIHYQSDPNDKFGAISPVADPYHPLTKIILWSYTIEGFIYSVLNAAQRN